MCRVGYNKYKYVLKLFPKVLIKIQKIHLNSWQMAPLLGTYSGSGTSGVIINQVITNAAFNKACIVIEEVTFKFNKEYKFKEIYGLYNNYEGTFFRWGSETTSQTSNKVVTLLSFLQVTNTLKSTHGVLTTSYRATNNRSPDDYAWVSSDVSGYGIWNHKIMLGSIQYIDVPTIIITSKLYVVPLL